MDVPVALRLGLTQEAPAGYRAGVVLANAATVLSLSAMGAVTLRTYLAGPSPALRTKLAGLPTGGVPAGYYAGFVAGQNSLLDVSVLSDLRLTTYKAGTQVETSTGANLLPDNKAQVSFVATVAFDKVRIERIGLLTALNDLQVFYGFGLAPAAFQGTNPMLSNFTAPVDQKEYEVSTTQRLLLTLASVSNPSFTAAAPWLTNSATPKPATWASPSSTTACGRWTWMAPRRFRPWWW